MNLEKESKMLEQGIIVWILFAVVILIVWTATFVSAAYVLTFTVMSPLWLWSAGAATVVTAGFVFAANKFLWK